MRIFSGSKTQKLSRDLIKFLEMSSNFDNHDSIDFLKIEKFQDGEILPLFLESIRHEDVYFVQSVVSSDSIMEILLVADAAKRAGCKSFNLISPYMGYSRQDKTDHIRSSIGSKVIADIFEKVGIDTLLTIDLHASSIQGFYNIPVIHLNGNKIFIEFLKNYTLDNMCIVAPDQGAVKKAFDFCKVFPESSFAMINKKRIKPNEVHSMELIGDVTGKNVIIIDDIADTLGTLTKAAEVIKLNGANSVRAIATHGVLSGKALENLEHSVFSEIFISDTVEGTENINSEKLRIVSCANLISQTLIALNSKRSIHEINLV